MHNSYRKCLQCKAPIEGRPNKKFCSDLCKGQHFRENNTLKDDSRSLVSQQAVKLSAAKYSETENSELDWDQQEEERQKQEEKVRAAEEQATRLHEQFCDLVNEFLQIEGKSLTERHVDRFLRQTERLTAIYRQHPHLKTPNTLVRNRLEELYAIHDIVQEVAQEIANKSMWQSKESSFEITKKWRKLLRVLLIAD